MYGRERVGGGGWGGGRALSLMLSAVLSPHRHIMRRIMNLATLGVRGWGGGPLSLKTRTILNGEGVWESGVGR